MTIVFHRGLMAEFHALLPVLRGLEGALTVVAPWDQASLAAQSIGASPMDIEMFEFTRLHAEGGPSRLSPAVADLFRQAVLILSYISSGQDPWASNVARLAPQAQVLCLATESIREHSAERLARAIRQSGVRIEPIDTDSK
ncbi:MAG: hypothetical protein AAGH88_07750 [Planctomycetota bacterium]